MMLKTQKRKLNEIWKTPVELVENKMSKSVGILSKASRSLNPKEYILH